MAPPSLTLTRLALLTLSLLGLYTLQITARTNGLFTTMAASAAAHTLPAPDSRAFNPHFTGLAPLDDVAAFVLMFFWPIVDGSAPGLSLVSFAFAGQACAAWALSVLEASRRGVGWGLVGWVSVYGLLCQLLGMGMVAPVYLALHTVLVGHVAAPTISSLSVPKIATLATVPAAVTLSYVVPWLALVLPASYALPLDRKLAVHNLWQVFPVTSSVCHGVLALIWPYSPAATPEMTVKYLRWVYKFALAVAVPCHLGTVGMAVAAQVYPGLFESGVVEELRVGRVFVPALEPFLGGGFGAVKVESVGQGALWFIQWDYLLAGLGYLVWAVAVNRLGVGFVGRKGGAVDGFGVGGVLKVGVRTLLLGPVGAAVMYIWERDELVFAGGEVWERKKAQ